MQHSLQCLPQFVIAWLVTLSGQVWSCPLCGPASPTLAEMAASASVVVIAKYEEGEQPDLATGSSGWTRYKIDELVKVESGVLMVNEATTLPRYRHGAPGDLVLMYGTLREEEIRWYEVVDISESIRTYMEQAPAIDAPTTERLTYFIRFLEHPEQVIATDAYSEFAIAPYADIVPLRPLMQPKQLREWIEHVNEPADRNVRVGLYGLMLGLSGDSSDAAFLESKILQHADNYAFGIDGLTGGYLLLTGDAGLQRLSEEILSNPEATVDEIFPILSAIRFAWTFGESEVPREGLIRAMRLLLKNRQLADLAMIDLARWRDWESMDEIVALFDDPRFNSPAIRRSVFRFLMTAETSAAPATGRDHVSEAQRHLQRLEKIDPKSAKSAARNFFE